MFRIFLLALVAVWYGAVLPGHQRGIVQLPGASADPCCDQTSSHHSDEPAQPPGSPRACAVCFYMAALSQAAPPDLGIAPLGLTERKAAELAPVPTTIGARPTYLGRAPPLS